MTTIDFDLPSRLEAVAPPSPRDGVRLMVGRVHDQSIEHRRFTDLPDILEPGDVLLVNTSATLPAALRGWVDGEDAEVHLSTRLPGDLWVVELRHVRGSAASTPWLDATAGTIVATPDGGRVTLVAAASPGRLWFATLDLPREVPAYLAEWGRPIRYGYVPRDFPLAEYQTVFATPRPDGGGSAEMPSAARPFSPAVVTRLVARGVVFAPFILHTGVSSLEAHEPPFAEWFRVPVETADLVNNAPRVIAVGTTAVRAIESVADRRGRVHPGDGWTEVVISPERPVRAVDGLITGWHEPQASHLAMLEAIAGRPLLAASYRAALDEGYLWHEFGDSHLILP